VYSGVSSASEESNPAVPPRAASLSSTDTGAWAFAPHVYRVLSPAATILRSNANAPAEQQPTGEGHVYLPVHMRAEEKAASAHFPLQLPTDPDANFITVFWGGDQTFKIVFPSFWA